MQYNGGDCYEGSWFQNLPSGWGVFKFVNGDRYEGQLENGEKHGFGREWKQAFKLHYQGQYKEGKMHGVGFYDKKDKFFYDGLFNRGHPLGFAQKVLPD